MTLYKHCILFKDLTSYRKHCIEYILLWFFYTLIKQYIFWLDIIKTWSVSALENIKKANKLLTNILVKYFRFLDIKRWYATHSYEHIDCTYFKIDKLCKWYLDNCSGSSFKYVNFKCFPIIGSSFSLALSSFNK